MTPTETAPMPTTHEVMAEVSTWPERAKAVVIMDDASYQFACDLVRGVKALRKKVEDAFQPNITRWVEGHRAALKEKREADQPLDEAERILKGTLAAWDREQAAARAEAQRRADAEAREREETERVALAAAMEAEAVAHGDAVLLQEAHALIEAPAAPVVAAPVAKPVAVKGVSYREVVKVRIDQPKLVPREYCDPNEARIRSVAQAMKGDIAIPGVTIWKERVVAVGGR